MGAYAVFETGTLADAVARAARVAPRKGAAYDKSAGIVLEADPQPGEAPIVTIKATDLQVFYLEYVNALEVGEEPISWRLPSGLFSDIASGLPLGEGHKVRISKSASDGRVNITSGRMKAKISSTDVHSYPRWEQFDPEGLSVVPDLSFRLKQVAWACDKANPPFSGVHLDGDYLTATDRYRFARVPCEVPVEKPITAPLDIVSSILNPGAEIRMGSEGNFLLLMPDDYTYIKSIIFQAPYPSREKVDSMLPSTYKFTVEAPKDQFIEKLQRMMVLVKTERYPTASITFTNDSIELFMKVEERGEIEEVIESIEFDDHFIFDITPTNLVEGLAAANAEYVSIGLGPDPNLPVYVQDGKGYQAWIMPRKRGD